MLGRFEGLKLIKKVIKMRPKCKEHKKGAHMYQTCVQFYQNSVQIDRKGIPNWAQGGFQAPQEPAYHAIYYIKPCAILDTLECKNRYVQCKNRYARVVG